MQLRLAPLVLQVLMLSAAVAFAAPPVKHRNLLLNPDEIEQVKAKIAKYPWAAAVLERTKKHALNGRPDGNNFVSQARYYTFTGGQELHEPRRSRPWHSMPTVWRGASRIEEWRWAGIKDVEIAAGEP